VSDRDPAEVMSLWVFGLALLLCLGTILGIWLTS
jgi:hypothetical protein